MIARNIDMASLYVLSDKPTSTPVNWSFHNEGLSSGRRSNVDIVRSRWILSYLRDRAVKHRCLDCAISHHEPNLGTESGVSRLLVELPWSRSIMCFPHPSILTPVL